MPDSPSRTPSPRRDRVRTPSLNIVDVDVRRISSSKTVNKNPDPPPSSSLSPSISRSTKDEDSTRRADARPGFQGNRDQIPDDMEKSRSERLHAIQDLKTGQSKTKSHQQYPDFVPQNRSPSPRRAKSGTQSRRASTSARSGKSGKSKNLSVSNYGQGPVVSGSINSLTRSQERPAKSAITNYSHDDDQMFCEAGCTCIECSDIGDLTKGYHCDTDSELSTEYVEAVYNTTSPSSFAVYKDCQEEDGSVQNWIKRQDQTRIDDRLACYEEERDKYSQSISRHTFYKDNAADENLDDR